MIYLGVGSSIGNAEGIFLSAENFLKKQGVLVIKKSSIYKNPPFGGVAKNEFSNGVWEVELNFCHSEFISESNYLEKKALTLLNILKKCEVAHKRDLNAKKWSDRTLDLDILMFDNLVIQIPPSPLYQGGLTIPHPEIKNRDFVLKPLMEIVDKNFKIRS